MTTWEIFQLQRKEFSQEENPFILHFYTPISNKTHLDPNKEIMEKRL